MQIVQRTIVLLLAIGIVMTTFAETEKIGGYTWTYRVNGEAAEIYNEYGCAISPKPTGTLMVPAIIGGKIVTSIGERAFYYCSDLTSVRIPNSVTSIGYEAFRGCSRLTNMTLPFVGMERGAWGDSSCFGYIFGASSFSGGTETTQYYEAGDVWSRSFYIPSSLTTVTITDEKTLGYGAFSNCKGLTSVTISNGVTSIGVSAFSGCSGLMSMTIPDSVTSIGGSAFNGCSGIRNVTVPQYVLDHQIRGVFPAAYKSITNVAYSSAITNIGSCVFYGCSGLTSVTIPDGVMSIGNDAFSGCSGLTNVTIPDSVTSIGSSAFYGCSSLFDTATISGVKLVDGWAVDKTGYLSGALDLTGVRGIGGEAFQSCYGLTEVMIPDGVTGIGAEAFRNCSGLKSILVPDSVTCIGEKAFRSCYGLTNVTIFSSTGLHVGADAFDGCSSLVAVEVNDIAAWCNIAFENAAANPLTFAHNLYTTNLVEALIVPDGVEKIGDYAFSGCSCLTSVTIPDSVISIGKQAFYDCSCSLFDTNSFPGVVLVDGWAVDNAGNLSGSLNLTRIRGIGAEAFSDCSSLTSVTIPDSVIGIGDGAFRNCSGMTSVMMMPALGMHVGHYAFNGCSNLVAVGIRDLAAWCGVEFENATANPLYYAHNLYTTKLVKELIVPDGVEDIGDYAFIGSGYLTSATIPDSVTNIGVAAFSGCSGLKDLSIGVNVMSIGQGAFNSCITLRDVTIPQCVCDSSLSSVFPSAYQSITNIVIRDGVTNISASAFSGCGGLTGVKIPDGVTRIGSSAFFGCSGITCMTIPNSVTSIGDNAFCNCSRLADMTIGNGVASIGNFAFSGCVGLSKVRISDMAAWCNIDLSGYTANPLYYAHNLYLNGSLVTDLVIPNGVESIKTYAFYDCRSLTNVTIPDSATNIGSYAFYCSGLTNAVISDSVECVGAGAFASCSKLKNVTIGNGVTNIDAYAFSGCNSLSHVTLPDRVSTIGDEVFASCASLTAVFFLGNAPITGSGIYRSTPSALTTFVMEDSTGWVFPEVPVLPDVWPTGDGNDGRSIATSNVSVNVEFDANGGNLEGMASSKTIYKGNVIGTLPVPAKMGFTFAGWWMPDGTKMTADTIVSVSLTVTARWEINPFTDAGEANWAQDGNGSWMSGITAHNATNTITMSVTGSGTIEFDWKTSCEGFYRTHRLDYLAFFVDDVEQGFINGETNWTVAAFEVMGAGEHTLSWSYVKDSEGTAGQDCAWLRNVMWTPTDGLAAWLAERGMVENTPAANGRTAAECYALGLDPTIETNDFRIVSFWMDGNSPMLEWEPKTNRWTGDEIKTTLKGAVNLDGNNWSEVTEQNKSSFRFFKVEVALP